MKRILSTIPIILLIVTLTIPILELSTNNTSSELVGVKATITKVEMVLKDNKPYYNCTYSYEYEGSHFDGFCQTDHHYNAGSTITVLVDTEDPISSAIKGDDLTSGK